MIQRLALSACPAEACTGAAYHIAPFGAPNPNNVLLTCVSWCHGTHTCRLKITEDSPAVAQAGEPFRIGVQIVAKLDQPFGWYQASPSMARVSLAWS